MAELGSMETVALICLWCSGELATQSMGLGLLEVESALVVMVASAKNLSPARFFSRGG